MLALPFMMHSKKYPNAIHDHEIEVMVKNVAFFAMLASHMGPTFKQRQNMIIIICHQKCRFVLLLLCHVLNILKGFTVQV